MKKLVVLLGMSVLLLGLFTACNRDEVEPDIIEEVTDTIEPEDEPDVEEVVVVEEVPDLGVLEVVSPKESVAINHTSYTSFSNHDRLTDADPVRGIYVSGHVAGINSWIDELIQLAVDTEVNAFVIDVKSDDGRILFDIDHPIVDEIGAEYIAISDVEGLMDKLYANDILPIARIVAFKDPFLSKNKTDYAIKNQDGSLFVYDGISWLNPYDEATWAYIVDVCKEAAKVGFKEIQFDYIRFAATYRLNDADFGDIDPEITKLDTIVHFLEYANEELEAYDVEISADVFGAIITSNHDAETIGQHYYRMAENLDIICPMVYPSHYSLNSYGVVQPDLNPYAIIYGSMMDSNEVLGDLVLNDEVEVRPWLQAFTASYLKYRDGYEYMVYNGAEMRVQMEAAYDAGLDSWILWDAAVTYPYSAFEPSESAVSE